MSGNPTAAVREELTRLVEQMVDKAEAVRITSSARRGEVLFTLTVAEDELGKVIGRHGRTANSLRALLAARGEHDGRRYALEIREPG